MPFCIGSTLLFVAALLEFYYAIGFKKLEELPHDVKESWLIAAILTLFGSLFGILDTCLLLGSESRISTNDANIEITNVEK